jgi:hypothetical protein
MQKLFLSLLALTLIISACQKRKQSGTVTPQVAEEVPEFKPTEQGEDYISENTTKSYEPVINNELEEKRRIKDGTYIADVEYFNTTTGANVTYVTKVMVKDGYLEVIKWPNGVWLASGYFKPQKIRQDGTCIVKNIEAGYENRVRILNLEYY